LDNKWFSEYTISRLYDSPDKDYIDHLIKQQRRDILYNLLDEIPDEQHFTIRFKTYRLDKDYDYFVVRTVLDITKVQYQDYKIVRFVEIPENNGLGGFIQQPEKKENWICVYCGHTQLYEITRIKFGERITEFNRKCQDCGGPKLS